MLHPGPGERWLARQSSEGAVLVDSMNRIWTLLAAVAALAALLTASRNEPEAERTWRFQGKEGIVEVRLTLYASNNETKKIASLQIYSPDGVPRSVPEEAGFIATVLDNLPSVGVNLQSLDSISFRFSEPEAVKRVAAYAAPEGMERSIENKAGLQDLSPRNIIPE